MLPTGILAGFLLELWDARSEYPAADDAELHAYFNPIRISRDSNNSFILYVPPQCIHMDQLTRLCSVSGKFSLGILECGKGHVRADST